MTLKNFIHDLGRYSALSPDNRTATLRGYAKIRTCLLGILCLTFIQSARPALKAQAFQKPLFAPTDAKSRIVDFNVNRAERLSFEENLGQVAGRTRFIARTRQSSFLLRRDGLIATLSKNGSKGMKYKAGYGIGHTPLHYMQTVRLYFSGANPESQLVGKDELATKTNYYPGPSQQIGLPAEPATAHVEKNRTSHMSRDLPIENVPSFKRVVEKNLYPGVDLVYHGNSGELEYDFIVAPNAKTDQIHLKFSGVERIRINRAGDLLLHTKAGDLKQARPKVYETADARDREISANYILLAKDEVGFRLQRKNPGAAVVIDPVLNYSTYFGTAADEQAKGVGVDSAGNAYIAGTSTVTANNNSIDSGFVSKYSPSGTRLFTTYIGDGTCSTDVFAIAVDGSGNSYVTGFTQPNSGGCGNDNVLAAKLSPTGTLIYGEYFPGGGDQGNAIAVDKSGNAYITGAETSTSRFFTTPGAFMTTSSAWIAFVSKLDPTGNFVYSTFLGGTGTGDGGNGIVVDGSGNAYVTGVAVSQDFPMKNAYQTKPDAFEIPNVFFTVLNAGGSGLIYSTYLSGTKGEGDGDAGNAVAVDSSGNAYIAGETASPDFPVTAGAFDTQCGTDGLCNPVDVCDVNGCRLTPVPDAFVAKINPNLSGTASLIYSTFLGGEAFDKAFGISVDNFGHAYVTGYTGSAQFPQVNSLQSLGGQNAFLTKVNSAGSGLLYSTYFGGSGTDSGNGIVLDSGGNVLIAGSTTSTNFPTKNAAQPNYGGGADDAFVAKFGFHHVPGDFAGDGKADVAVFRPSNGFWYVIPGGTPTAFLAKQWGAQGDIPVRGDYDGDGQTDFAVFRPSNGLWYIIPSSNPTNFIVQQWGASGDIPVPGDYDGDGKTDIAVFRPSTGTWYIVASSNPGVPIIRQWGASGDIPVPGDYDGDGKTDSAVFRPSNGTWYIAASSTGVPIIRQWGASGDIPVPADYDGDGKTDSAVWRPSNGTWYIAQSSTGVPIIRQWGGSGDIPVPADYDGDQIADTAVWRPSNGNWYIISSTTPNNFTITQWGMQDDVPVQKPVGH